MKNRHFPPKFDIFLPFKRIFDDDDQFFKNSYN